MFTEVIAGLKGRHLQRFSVSDGFVPHFPSSTPTVECEIWLGYPLSPQRSMTVWITGVWRQGGARVESWRLTLKSSVHYSSVLENRPLLLALSIFRWACQEIMETYYLHCPMENLGKHVRDLTNHPSDFVQNCAPPCSLCVHEVVALELRNVCEREWVMMEFLVSR